MTPGKEFQVTYGTIAAVTNVAVKITTEDGTFGWGETSCSTSMFYFSGETQASVRAAIKNMAPSLLGKEADNLNLIHETVKYVQRNQAKCALDIALHDLIGKQQGVPVYKLLGGALANEMPMSYTLGISSPKHMAEEAVKKVGEGFNTIEVKVGGKNSTQKTMENDIASVRAVRDAIGNDVTLIVDANSGWSVRQTLWALKKIEDLDILLEQPTRFVEGLREVRKKTSVPIIADESCQGLQDTVRLIEMEAADILSIKLTKFAGFYESARIIGLSDAFGLDYRYDNMSQSRLAATASLHLALAYSRGIPSGGTAFTKYEDDLVKSGGLRMNHGTASLENPKEPGLGITINEKLLGPADVYKA